MSLFALVPILYLVGNAYVFWRGKQALQAQPKGRRLLFALVYWLGALSIFPEFLWHSASSPVYLLRLLHQVGTGWMVFTLYMVLALLAFDVLRLCRLRIKGSFWVALLLTLVSLGYGYYHYKHPSIKEIDILIDKPLASSLKIVAISDVHLGYGTGKQQLADYVRLINAQQPDLILIAGDLIDNDLTPVKRERMQDELNDLRAPLGIYMVPGNHDYFGGIEACEEFIRWTDICLLRDSLVQLPNGIQLIGRDDRRNRSRLPLSTLAEQADASRPIILLDHQPYDLGTTARCGIDLQFSGHTHHGQIWPLTWLTDYLFELSYGYRAVGESQIFVSSGLSLWGPPFRIGTDSEVVVFRLTSNLQ